MCVCRSGWCASKGKRGSGGGSPGGRVCEPVAAEHKAAALQLRRIASEKQEKKVAVERVLARRYRARLNNAASGTGITGSGSGGGNSGSGRKWTVPALLRERRQAAEVANKKMQAQEALFKRQVATKVLAATCPQGKKRVKLPWGLGWRCVENEATAERKGKGKQQRHRKKPAPSAVGLRKAARARKALAELQGFASDGDSGGDGGGGKDGSDQYEEQERKQIDEEHGIGGGDPEADRIAYMHAHMHSHVR